METIYLVVGKQVREAKARIVGKIAEVSTPHGIREFGKWHRNKEDALLSLNGKRARRSRPARRAEEAEEKLLAGREVTA